MMRTKTAHRCRGFSLIEIMIAVMIAGVVSIAFMSAVIFMIRQNGENKQHYNAVQAANYFGGLVSAASYEKLGAPGLESDDFEKQFDYDDENPYEYAVDPQYEEKSHKLDVWFEFSGWGDVDSASNTSLTADLPDNQDNWVADEWKGSYVTIVSGKGKGQIMRITGNGSKSLNVTGDLTGNTSEEFVIQPDDTSTFVINNGKRVRVHVGWGDGERHRHIVRELLVRRQFGEK